MNLRSVVGSWYAPLWMHGLNQQQAMQRAAAAKAQGLDPQEFGTMFPGSNVTTTNNVNNGGWLKGALLSAALLAAGTGGGVGLNRLLTPAAPPPSAPVPARPAAQPAYDAVTEEQQPDGSWKPVKRERLPLPK